MVYPVRAAQQQRKVVNILLALIAAILLTWMLRATYVVTMPLAFSFFLTVLVYPVQDWLRRHLPRPLRWLSLVVVVLIVLAMLAIGVALVWIALDRVATRAPDYSELIDSRLESLARWIWDNGTPVTRHVVESEQIRQTMLRLLSHGLTSIWWGVAMGVLIFFIVLLMLLEVRDWGEKSRRAFRGHLSDEVVDMVAMVAHKLRSYLLLRTFISVLTGVSSGLWLWVAGVDFAFVWGLLLFLLNYIPNIGSIVAVIPPTLTAMLQFGPWPGLLVLGGLTVIQMFLGNFLEPRMTGRSLSVSPVVMLLSILFWGWVWGVAGALLAVPMTVTIITICAHVPSLRAVAVLLSGVGEEERLDGEPVLQRNHRPGDDSDTPEDSFDLADEEDDGEDTPAPPPA